MNPWTDGPPAFEHHSALANHEAFALLGVPMFLLFLILLAGTFLLVRRGQFGPPPWLNRPSPEAEAKKILAERFARGDIDSADFMERASILNWTPGSDVVSHHRPNKRR